MTTPRGIFSDGSTTTLRHALAAFWASSSAFVVTVILGAGTNKIVALGARADGIALLGIYRSFASTVAVVLQLGASETTMQRISTKPGEARNAIRSISVFLMAQIVLLLLLAFAAAEPLAALLFDRGEAGARIREVRLLVLMSGGVLALQTVNAILSGLGQVRVVAMVSVVTATLTLALAWPLVRLGTIGLPLLLGLSCFAGAAIGAARIVREVRRLPATSDRLRFPVSLPLAIQPFILLVSWLVVQSLVADRHGLAVLGHLSAAMTIEGIAVMTAMAAMKPYSLPALTSLRDDREKSDFMARTLRISLAGMTAESIGILLIAPIAVPILFTGEFGESVGLLRILALGIVPQAFVWNGAIVLLHKSDLKTYAVLDGIWAFVRIAFVITALAAGASVEGVAWAHVASYFVSAILYIAIVSARHGRSFVSGPGIAAGCAAIAGVVAVFAALRVLA